MATLKLLPLVAIYMAVFLVITDKVANCEEMDFSLASADMLGGLGSPAGPTCDDCGARCKIMCRTRKFRLCCMQYMRKRSENMLANSGNNPDFDGFPTMQKHPITSSCPSNYGN